MGKLTKGNRGYYARIAGKPRWICSSKFTLAEAQKKYHQLAAALLSGATPQREAKVGGIIDMHYILGRWLMDHSHVSATCYDQYKRSAKRLDACLGWLASDQVTPADVRAAYNKIAQEHGADAAARAIQHCRQASSHAWDVLGIQPVRLGKPFRKSGGKSSIKWRYFTPAELARIFAAVNDRIAQADGRGRDSWMQFRAMLFLALNGGYGAKELADLPRAVVDLERGVIDYARGKTGASHVVPLWPETVEAIRAIPATPGDPLLFRTRQGNPWCISERKGQGKRVTDHINERFTEILKGLGLKIRGEGFGKLRHLHATVSDEAGDVHATFELRGHSIPGASRHYIRVSEDRVRKVVEYVRHKLILR